MKTLILIVDFLVYGVLLRIRAWLHHRQISLSVYAEIIRFMQWLDAGCLPLPDLGEGLTVGNHVMRCAAGLLLRQLAGDAVKSGIGLQRPGRVIHRAVRNLRGLRAAADHGIGTRGPLILILYRHIDKDQRLNSLAAISRAESFHSITRFFTVCLPEKQGSIASICLNVLCILLLFRLLLF